MVVRDTRRAASSSARDARCTVYMSVPTVDEDAWRTLEPGTAHPLQRLRAVRELVDAGINAGVLMAPIVPGFSSSRAKLERTIKAIADHGARFVGCNVMYLQDGTRDALHEVSSSASSRRWLPRFERLYAKKYPPDAYRKEVQGDGARAAGALRAAARETRRDAEHDAAQADSPPRPKQVGVRVVSCADATSP